MRCIKPNQSHSVSWKDTASSTDNCIYIILQLTSFAQDYQYITFLKNSYYGKMKQLFLKTYTEIYLKTEKEWHFHALLHKQVHLPFSD